jgi:LysR family glycine cleavage system transcriptional activator
MRRIPSTATLLAFEAAARRLSFQAAAEELNVTPGAVSRQIQALEEQTGAALFTRHHRRVALTPQGRRYLTDIRLPLEKLAEATTALQGETRGQAISICAYPSFAIRWFIPRWGRFHDDHPHIDLRLTTTLEPADFETGQYHMSLQILGEGETRPGLTAEKLLEVDTFPVCRPELAREIDGIADLRRHTLLHGAPRPEDWTRWLSHAGHPKLKGARNLRFESVNLALQAAIEGLGVAMAWGAMVEDDLAAGRLVRLFDVTRRSGRPLHMVYPETRAADPQLAAVRDWLLAEAGRSQD